MSSSSSSLIWIVQGDFCFCNPLPALFVFGKEEMQEGNNNPRARRWGVSQTSGRHHVQRRTQQHSVFRKTDILLFAVLGLICITMHYQYLDICLRTQVTVVWKQQDRFICLSALCFQRETLPTFQNLNLRLWLGKWAWDKKIRPTGWKDIK